MKVLVLDASAIIMGLDPLGLEFQSYSVPEVNDEIREQSGLADRLAVSKVCGKLKIQTPTDESRKVVSKVAMQLGDHLTLSQADASLLALALDLSKEGKDPVLVTDDYAVQNVALGLRVAYQSLATFGIRLHLQWKRYCPACFKEYTGEEVWTCTVCGTALKRKPVKSVRASGNRDHRIVDLDSCT